MKWKEFDWFKSGECQVIHERLADMKKAGKPFNPERSLIYAAMDAVSFDSVRVAIIGQDPYPAPNMATGIAFSVPSDTPKKEYPVTLKNIFQEYCDDLKYPYPSSGDLTPWCKQGVFLWNARPTCARGKPASHEGWFEYDFLNKEILQRLTTNRDTIVLLVGFRAKELYQYCAQPENVLQVGHPSPRGNVNAKVPFLGSRPFSTINDYLAQVGLPPVDWKLP